MAPALQMFDYGTSIANVFKVMALFHYCLLILDLNYHMSISAFQQFSIIISSLNR